MNLFQLGNFVLASGQQSDFKIDCDALTDEDLEAAAALLARLVGPFGSVEGVPTGGLRLAKTLQPYRTCNGCGHAYDDHDDYMGNYLGCVDGCGCPVFDPSAGLLVVDDVWTTGLSMLKYLVRTARKVGKVKGAVLFARGPTTTWVTPLFRLTESPMPDEKELPDEDFILE